MAMNLFATNPSLVGFESPSRMLISTIKELFEVITVQVCCFTFFVYQILTQPSSLYPEFAGCMPIAANIANSAHD